MFVFLGLALPGTLVFIVNPEMLLEREMFSSSLMEVASSLRARKAYPSILERPEWYLICIQVVRGLLTGPIPLLVCWGLKSEEPLGSLKGTAHGLCGGWSFLHAGKMCVLVMVMNMSSP